MHSFSTISRDIRLGLFLLASMCGGALLRADGGLPVTSASMVVVTDSGLFSVTFLSGDSDRIATPVFVYPADASLDVSMTYEVSEKRGVLRVGKFEKVYSDTPLLLWDSEKGVPVVAVSDVASLAEGQRDHLSVQTAVVKWVRKHYRTRK